MAKDNGTPDSLTLDTVKKMGYKPIAISLLEGEEVFVFKTQQEADEAETDFYPEGVWVTEAGFAALDQKKLKKVYNFKKIKAELDTKIGVIDANRKGVTLGMDKPLKSSISGNVYCFTGFRNEILEKNIEAMGAKVEPRVTNRTTHLIMKDLSKRTVKAQQAIDKGCEIVELAAFNKAMTEEAIKVILGLDLPIPKEIEDMITSKK